MVGLVVELLAGLEGAAGVEVAGHGERLVDRLTVAVAGEQAPGAVELQQDARAVVERA